VRPREEDRDGRRKVADPDRIAVWLSGYFNAKRDKTILDVQQFKENGKKLIDEALSVK
jgi:hypothetical protein